MAGIIKEVGDPPNKAYRCPLCFAWLHFIGPWHCYNCGTDWETEDLLEAIETDEYEEVI